MASSKLRSLRGPVTRPPGLNFGTFAAPVGKTTLRTSYGNSSNPALTAPVLSRSR